MKKTILIALFLGLAFSAICVGEEINVAVGNYPSIYANKIVWLTPNDNNIHLYDLGPDGIYGTADDSGEVQVTSDSHSRSTVSIYGNKIVWKDTAEIFLYDLGPDGIYGTGDDSGEVQVSLPPGNKKAPAIYESKIAWVNGDSFYLYDLGPDGIYGTPDDSGEVRIGGAANGDFIVADYFYRPLTIYGNKIVWTTSHLDWGPMHSTLTYYLDVYDLGDDGIFGTADDSGPTRINTDIVEVNGPVDIPLMMMTPHYAQLKIYQHNIIWRSFYEGEWGQPGDIFVYSAGPDGIFGNADDSGKVRLTTSHPYHPDIYQNTLVFGENNDIYSLQLLQLGSNPASIVGRKTRLTNDPTLNRGRFQLYGFKVVYNGYRQGDQQAKVYLLDFSPASQVGPIGK